MARGHMMPPDCDIGVFVESERQKGNRASGLTWRSCATLCRGRILGDHRFAFRDEDRGERVTSYLTSPLPLAGSGQPLGFPNTTWHSNW